MVGFGSELIGWEISENLLQQFAENIYQVMVRWGSGVVFYFAEKVKERKVFYPKKNVRVIFFLKKADEDIFRPKTKNMCVSMKDKISIFYSEMNFFKNEI